MKLLMKSMLRHVKQHMLQTFLTFLVTVLIMALLSAVFCFISSFQMQLRRYAFETVGNYHYWYTVPRENIMAEMLLQVADEFEEDHFFSEVLLEESEEIIGLKLTVASPGLFTTKTVEKKMHKYQNEFLEQHRQDISNGYIYMLNSQHNFSLLISYGDLHKDNGVYSLLLVVFFVIAAIAAVSALTLGTIFRVSEIQRERDFALLMSVGASGTQIKAMVLLESVFYIVLALPAGFLLGVFFFDSSRGRIDDLLYSIDKFPPIELVVSVPYSAVMLLCAIVIILGSAWKPANRAAQLCSIEALRQTQSLHVLDREQRKKGRKKQRKQHNIDDKNLFGIIGWLAEKNGQRFRRRYLPVFSAIAVTVLLCFVLDGFQRFTTEVANMFYSEQKNNISIELYSDDVEKVNEVARELKASLEEELCIIREAIFELHPPYLLSEKAEDTDFLRSTAQSPDILLFSVEQEVYEEICRSIGIDPNTAADQGEGIFIDAERMWKSNGMTYKGSPYQISKGDVITIYQTHISGRQTEEMEEGIAIKIAGVLKEFPLYTEIDMAVRMAVLIPEEMLISLEPLCPHRKTEWGAYHISLRGLVEDAYETERTVSAMLQGRQNSSLIARVNNYDKELQQEKASIAGFRYLMWGLILLLVLICICGNFIVSWTVANTRKKEFAVLTSLGMTPKELQAMRWIEQLRNSICAFLPGCFVGLFCYQLIYKLYSKEFSITWGFPWKGFAMSLAILCVSAVFTEFVVNRVLKSSTIAEQLRVDEM